MEFEWHDVVGSAGVTLILLAYGLLQLGRLRAESLTYSLLNWFGPGLVLASLSRDFNLAAAVLEGAWMMIATVGIATWYIHRRNAGLADVEAHDTVR
jgi:hypothetical protein